MARATMADLITRTRDLIGDTDSDAPTFSDDQIQDALDAHRFTYRNAALRSESSYDGLTVVYVIFHAPYGDWEDSVELRASDGTLLSPTDADLVAGRWEIPASPVYQTVLLSGRSYDLAAAGADLLDNWAVRLSRQFDFSADGGSFSRSQQVTLLGQAAAALRARTRPVTRTLVKTDDA